MINTPIDDSSFCKMYLNKDRRLTVNLKFPDISRASSEIFSQSTPPLQDQNFINLLKFQIPHIHNPQWPPKMSNVSGPKNLAREKELTASPSFPVSIRRRGNCRRHRNPRHVSSRCRKNSVSTTGQRLRGTIQRYA